MAYEYNVPGLDLGAVAKTFTDQLYRNAQLQAKRQQALDKQFENEFKIFSGKIRRQDLSEFESVFAEYKDMGKTLQKANKGIFGNISSLSMGKDMSKDKMMNYISESAQIGEYAKNLNKYRSDAKYLADRDKLDAILMDASTLTTNQFKDKYGDVSGWPKVQDFEWKPEKYDDSKNYNDIKKTLFFNPSSTLNSMRAKNDDGTDKKMELSFSVNGGQKRFEVPVITVTANPDPYNVLERVRATSYNPSQNTFYKWLKDKTIAEAKDPANPSMQAAAQKKLSFASQLYNTDVESLTPEQVYAAGFINPDRPSSFEVPDFKALDKMLDLERFEMQKAKNAIQLKKLNQEISQIKNDFGIKTAQKYVTLFKGLQEIGATSSEQWMNQFGPIFSGVGLPVDDATIKQMFNNAIETRKNTQYGFLQDNNQQQNVPFSPIQFTPGSPIPKFNKR